jgi:hypothetical protein
MEEFFGNLADMDRTEIKRGVKRVIEEQSPSQGDAILTFAFTAENGKRMQTQSDYQGSEKPFGNVHSPGS